MGLKEAVTLIAEVPYLPRAVALQNSALPQVAQVTKAMKDHLPLQIEAELMSSTLTLANKATKIVNG